MRPMLVVVFGMRVIIDECHKLLTDIGNICHKSSFRLIVTQDPVRVLSKVEDPELEVIHLVNPAKFSLYMFAGICEMLADEMEPLAKKPTINIGDRELRFLGTIFRNRGIVVTETDLTTAVRHRWEYLQAISFTTT